MSAFPSWKAVQAKGARLLSSLILVLACATFCSLVSLLILFGPGTAFADSLPPATGFMSASGWHAPGGGCSGACVPTLGSGSLIYTNSGGGPGYTWSEAADVTETLGPGIPAVGTVYATGSASVGGNWINNEAESTAGASTTFFFSVDQIKAPTFAPPVIPVYFEAYGKAQVDGYGGYEVVAGTDADPGVEYSMVSNGGYAVSKYFSETATVDLVPNYEYFVQIGATGWAFADFDISSSDFVVSVDPTFAFDQTAFDAMYGSNAFPLAEYYSLDFSPNVPVSGVPEPCTLLLLGTSLVGLAGFRILK